MVGQLVVDKAWWPVAAILLLFGLVPGMPTTLFLGAHTGIFSLLDGVLHSINRTEALLFATSLKDLD
jgi:flagellar biosynthesis component FlhA